MNINLYVIRPIRWSALILMLTLVATNVFAAADEFTERFDFAPGQTLKLDLSSGGSVTIEGWDQPGIEVTYGDEYNSLDQYSIDFEPSPTGLSVNASQSKHANSSSIYFKFKAPREMILDLYTAGGSLKLSGLTGQFSGKTGGGALLIDDLAGDVSLRTGGGRILVQNSVLNGEVHTGGGKVLIDNVTGDLEASSGGGAVTYKNVRANDGRILSPNKRDLDDASEATVLISNQGGKIRVDAAPEGADVYTGGGNIQVKGADRFVSAKTGGGDIDIEILQGWIEAGTGAGEIEVFVAENSTGDGHIKLTSGNGDVQLTLPENFSMDLSVELGVTNNSRKKYTLSSDFDINIKTDDDWDYSRGTPRKYTHGTASLNGGDHHISIHTTNGNVVIRKAN